MTQPFTHLRSHTEFSIVESTLRIDDLITKAKTDGQPAVAMTDLDGFFGAIRFYEAARKEGVKPIVGTDIQLALNSSDDNPTQPPRRVLLIAKDFQGYLKLMRLISRGYTVNLHNDKPVIKESWIHEEGAEGLFCLSGNESGHIAEPALAGDLTVAKANAMQLKKLFGDNFFIEVQRRGIHNEAEFIQTCVTVARETQIPLVATHPIQFSHQSDYVAHELKVCDSRKDKLPDRNRARDFTPYQHFMTTSEMEQIFSDLPDAIENARHIAQSCSLTIPLGKPELPDFQTGTDESLSDFFVRVTNEGLIKRMTKLYPDPTIRASKFPEYQARLNHEIQTIQKMGFEGYFMIVYDFINWAHQHEIPVGPGRGSGAGSLVAYSLNITDLDPLKYNLIFERFLNPERVSMPDFDIDFCIDGRQLVIDYVIKKYGKDSVAGITAIGTLAARAAVNAAGRALGMNPKMVQEVSKLIPNKPGHEVSISDAILEVPEVINRYDEPEIKKLLDHAITLEGLPKSVGKHAAGVVIARGRIADYSPIYVPSNTIKTKDDQDVSSDSDSDSEDETLGNNQVTTQYDKDDLEKVGLVKFDFLGLKNLTMIDKAVRLIKAQPEHKDFDLTTIPLDDPKVYELFQRGDTQAVFQFASPGIRQLLRDAQPNCIEDLTALNALYRPGPMDLMSVYCENKAQPSQIKYLDPRMKTILSETYGIMIYQEQVMQIAQTIGGYTLGGADLLRRAMGKKKPEEMAKHRQIFNDGAVKNGVQPKVADEIFTHMEKFAGYGFNKSHSAAYSVVAYQTAYLKTNFPSAYFAAVLSVESVKDVDTIPNLINDAKSKGVIVLPPDINTSQSTFTTSKDVPNGLVYGLEGIKGVGTEVVQQIINARRIYGQFTSLEDFLTKFGKCIPPQGYNLVNKTVISALINAGCFDSLHPNRAETLAAYPIVSKYIKDVANRNEKIKKRESNVLTITDNALGDLFAMSNATPIKNATSPKAKKEKPINEIQPYVWPTLDPQTLMEKLENEKKAFGFYFSGHPMTHFKNQLGDLKTCEPISELLDAYPSYDALHLVAGVISEIKIYDSKKGKMAKGVISDGQSSFEFVAFSDTYAKVKDWIKKDAFALLTVQVKTDKFKGGNGYTAIQILNLPDAQIYLAEKLNLSIDRTQIDRLKEIIASRRTESSKIIPISLWHPHEDTHIKSTEPIMEINISMELLDQLKQEFGPHVKLAYPNKRLEIAAPPRRYKQ